MSSRACVSLCHVPFSVFVIFILSVLVAVQALGSNNIDTFGEVADTLLALHE